MARRDRPKPLDIVSRNLVDRLWDEKDPVCDRKALVIVRNVLGQVAAEAAREATRKASRLASAERAVIEAVVDWRRLRDSDCDQDVFFECCDRLGAAVDALLDAQIGGG